MSFETFVKCGFDHTNLSPTLMAALLDPSQFHDPNRSLSSVTLVVKFEDSSSEWARGIQGNVRVKFVSEVALAVKL